VQRLISVGAKRTAYRRGNHNGPLGRDRTPPAGGYNDSPVTSVTSAEVKRWLMRAFVVGLASALGLTALAYAIDFAVFRYRVATNRQPYGQITVTSYDAVPQKSGKTQFIFHSPEAQTCVNSLFPREGYEPCWYLQRHAEQRVDM
jgi:hypothetical protein